VANELLLDTGGLVSIIDRSQRGHEEFARYFENWDGDIVSTEAVLTEATHLLRCVSSGATTCIDFFLKGGAIMVPTSFSILNRVRVLMRKYDDLPMDYADATLVALAEELDTGFVLTTDKRDFSVYRRNGRKRFQICPQ
jgi:predicted nucleic acid-binding protein